MAKGILVLLRHGQSVWNKENLFTGWVDVPLSNQGIKEAIEAGVKINFIPFEVMFTSTLVRAQSTLFLAMSQHMKQKTLVVQHPEEPLSKIHNRHTLENTIPVFYSSALNERMYGKLQGKNKDEARREFGEEQVHLWRRSFDLAPPEGESLKMTSERTLPYFKETIVPYIKNGHNVLVSAHGNSLRSIVMYIQNLTPDEVVKLEIPTGVPLCYTFGSGKWMEHSIEGLKQRPPE